MKVIVPVIGIKGGSGKSTTAQTLAYGVDKLGHLSFLMSTDPRRREGRGILDNRTYMNLDGRTEQGLYESLEAFLNFQEGNELSVLVIDGGANESRDLDKSLTETCQNADKGIAIIPFMRSPDDLDSAKIELEFHINAIREQARIAKLEFPDKPFKETEVRALPNRWPTNHLALKKANEYMAKHLAGFEGRILEPNFDCNATIDFMGDMDNFTASTLNSAAKKLAEQVLAEIGINVFDKEFPNE